MKHPALLIEDAMQALQALGKATHKGLAPTTIALVHLRASQINACGVCVDMHARELEELGTTSVRLAAVAAWRDTPFFSEAERAALALTEAVTRMSDDPESVTDAIWADAAKHFDERELAVLILNIAQINLWNRLNVPIRALALGRKWTPADARNQQQ